MKIAIDLLWVKHQKVGGVESYIHNLLSGFTQLTDNFEIILVVAKDNRTVFEEYANMDSRYSLHICPNKANEVRRSIWWMLWHLDSELRKLDVDICFSPVPRLPLHFLGKRNKYITVVHDLQALHYPEYFNWIRRSWLSLSWRFAVRHARRVVAISNFVKDDIMHCFGTPREKIRVIYNPINVDAVGSSIELVEAKYDIHRGEYYYTISSLLTHKNLMTLIRWVQYREELGKHCCLVVSGIGVGHDNHRILWSYIKEHHLEKSVIFTGFVSNEERNTLIRFSRCFLFPSVFEGFGMPVVEGLELGTRVVSTRCASLYEVSEGRACYVENPYSVDDWEQTVCRAETKGSFSVHFREYEPAVVAQKYIELFREASDNSEFCVGL